MMEYIYDRLSSFTLCLCKTCLLIRKVHGGVFISGAELEVYIYDMIIPSLYMLLEIE